MASPDVRREFVLRGDDFITCATRPGCISNGNAPESWGVVHDPKWKLVEKNPQSQVPSEEYLPICLAKGAPERKGFEGDELTMLHRICPWAIYAMFPRSKVVKRG